MAISQLSLCLKFANMCVFIFEMTWSRVTCTPSWGRRPRPRDWALLTNLMSLDSLYDIY